MRSRHTRERLIWAVEAVIRDWGIEGATVRAIARRAGVAVGTIYRRFPNKRALITAVQTRFLGDRGRRISLGLRLARRQGLARALTLREFLHAMLLGIERDRPMLTAFLRASCPERALHDDLRAAFGPRGGGGGEVTFLADLLLLALRAQVVDPRLPSDRGLSRHRVAESLADHFARSFDL